MEHDELIKLIFKEYQMADKDKYTNLGLMVKCTPERGHNALFFIPLQVFIML